MQKNSVSKSGTRWKSVRQIGQNSVLLFRVEGGGYARMLYFSLVLW